ncbi:hypothetical protein DV735_g5144, partial [Chaetothyriales sp. CBS 134920]
MAPRNAPSKNTTSQKTPGASRKQANNNDNESDNSDLSAPMMMLPHPAFFATLRSLLDRELAAETAEASLLLTSTPPTVLARAGLAILNLTVSSLRTGMGGRTVIELALDPAVIPKGSAGDLPEHAIRTGDIVRVGPKPSDGARKKDRSETEAKGVEGVVVKVRERALQVALGKEGGGGGSGKDDDAVTAAVPDGNQLLWLVKLANDVTYRRMDQALKKITAVIGDDISASSSSYSSLSPLQRILLGLDSQQPASLDSVRDLAFFNPSLNESQREAIRFALAAPHLALIHGPPGTGKTYTLIELILQFLRQGQRVLVCGPSNISVDNIVERLALAAPQTELVRLGHPARLLPAVLDHSLEVLTRTSDAAAIVNDVRTEIDDKLKSISKTRSGRERRLIYQDVKELRREFREREAKAVDGLLRRSKVVLATLHGAGSRQTKDQDFDVVIVDEAGQAVEPAKLVLAGDHLQLPPTVKGEAGSKGLDANKKKKSIKALEEDLANMHLDDILIKRAKAWSLETTMFERIKAAYSNDSSSSSSIGRMLEVQYRMNTAIMTFPSQTLYNNRLSAADSAKDRLLRDIAGVAETDETKEAVVFYDTQGGDFSERAEEEEGEDSNANGADRNTLSSRSLLLNDSKSNEMEALVVRMHVRRLVDEAGVSQDDIAVITPYNAQLAVLSALLRDDYPRLEMGSVDGFQGREKEAVIVSLVRSNPKRDVGFLADKRRLNVAITRPKRHLCVVGDSETVSRGSAFLKSYMAWLEENADLRYPTAEEVLAGGTMAASEEHVATYQRAIITHGLHNEQLMYQILALSALHLSVERPSRQYFYHAIASDLQSKALEGLKQRMESIDRSNCIEAVLFSHLIATHVMRDAFHSLTDNFDVFLERLVGGIRLVNRINSDT